MRFLAIFLSLVCLIDLILHIVIVLNVYQLSAMLPGQAGSFKNQKNAFLSAPILSFLFYSLLILLLYLLLQTRPNQQYLNTTNDHRGFSTEFLLVDIDNSVSSLRVLSEMRRKSELWFSTCPLPGTVLD